MPFVRAGETLPSKPVIASSSSSSSTTTTTTTTIPIKSTSRIQATQYSDEEEEEDVTHFYGSNNCLKNFKLTLHIIIRHWQD